MYYYQFNIGDYISHTNHLDLLEDLAYRRMMDWCYLNESPLPDDIEEIAKRIRMRTHCESIAFVLSEFFVPTKNGYEQKRITEEVKKYKSKSLSAKKSAESRWDKKRLSESKPCDDANALRTDSEGNAKHKTINNKHKTINKLDFSAWPQIPDDSKLSDLMALRKSKKAALSQTVVTGLSKTMHELNSAGISVNQVLEIWCLRGWQGLKKDWVIEHIKKEGFSNGGIKPQRDIPASNLTKHRTISQQLEDRSWHT